MGARLPPRLHAPRGGSRKPRAPSVRGIHRDSHAGGSGGHLQTAHAPRPSSLCLGIREAQSLIQRPRSFEQGGKGFENLRACRRRRGGHRLLRHAKERGVSVGAARGTRNRPYALPRGDVAAGEGQIAGRLHKRKKKHCGRHKRVRHGHRQARHKVRLPLRAARERRGSLPGIRTRRTRRARIALRDADDVFRQAGSGIFYRGLQPFAGFYKKRVPRDKKQRRRVGVVPSGHRNDSGHYSWKIFPPARRKASGARGRG